MAKGALLMENFINAECVCQITQLCELSGLAACTSSLICNHTLIGQHFLATSGNCSPVRLLLDWLSDLEQWRDIRASKSCARTAVGVHA